MKYKSINNIYSLKSSKTRKLIGTVLLSILLSGCTSQSSITPEFTQNPTETVITIPFSPDELEISPHGLIGLTYQSLDGNRYIEGKGNITNTEPIDIPLNGKPVWLVAVATQEGNLWVVVLEDGSVQAFNVANGEYSPFNIIPDSLPAGMPPILSLDGTIYRLNPFASMDASINTHSIPLNGSFSGAYLNNNGELLFSNLGEPTLLRTNALPDARILVDEQERLLFLSSPTIKYNHGIAGDEFEAESITLVGSSPSPSIIQEILIPDGKVVEGIAPIWVDINGDGQREIIVTVSDAIQGAQIMIFNESGEIIAVGEPIGLGFRWRHQIAVAPFGPNGELELVDVLTPHIGGVVEFFQLNGNTLTLVADVRGYTSHKIGSKNMDMAIAGDFDGDGKVELLLPNQAMNSIALIQRIDGGAIVEWEVSLGAVVSSNFVAVRFSNGSIAVGVGLDNGTLRLWLP